jgi:hypothetical protein
MRAFSIFLAATALLTTASTALADGGSAGSRPATAQEMDEASGTYKLSDGRRAELFVLDARLFVRIGKRQQKELLLDGPNRFATRDGKLVVRFDPGSDNARIVLEHERGIGSLDTIRLAANDRPGRGTAD